MLENKDSGNINSLWLSNIYENLKKIEEYERLAREGCSSVFEYLQIPNHLRDIQIANAQYKNLRCLLNEFILVLPDLSPVLIVKDLKDITRKIKLVTEKINDKKLFVVETKYTDKRIKTTYTTKFFSETLDFLSDTRMFMINKISHVLYINDKRAEKESKRLV